MTNLPAIADWNRTQERAKDEYDLNPHSGVTWCIECVHPAGATKDCEHCKATRRARNYRAKKRAERRGSA